MTKKDFVAIQQSIKDARDAVGDAPGASRVFDSLARSVADVLATQSGKFKRAAFLTGCGVEGGR